MIRAMPTLLASPTSPRAATHGDRAGRGCFGGRLPTSRRSRPPPQRVHARRRPGGSPDGVSRRGPGRRAGQHRHPRRHPPAGRRGRCRADRLPRPRRTAARRWPRRWSSPTCSATTRVPGLPLRRLAGGRTRAEIRRAARRAGPADRGRGAGARLRPTAASPDGRRHAGRRPPAAGRLQRRARTAGDAPGRPSDRGGDPRGRRARACRGVRAIGLWLDQRGSPRSRPTSRTTARPRSPRWWPRSPGTPGRAPSWSGLRPRAASRASRRTCRCAPRARSKTRSPPAPRKLRSRWHRPSASVVPSTAAPPPERSARGAAPAARRRAAERKKQTREQAR